MNASNFSGLRLFLGAGAILLASCTGENGGLFGGDHNSGNSGDGGIDMGVAIQGLTSDQSFCFSWTLFQEDSDGGWSIIDQREDPVCGAPGSLEVSDFATCYDGLHFLVQYDITVQDGNGVIALASATSGGGDSDVCVSNTDTNSVASIQYNNEGSAGGVNPGIDIDQVCSNDKLQLEGDQLVSALWLQPDACECVSGETPDSYCVIGSGEGISTSRYDLTVDGFTRFLFNTSDQYATWDLLYLAFEPDMDLSTLSLFNAPFAMHHYADNGSFGREELSAVGSFRIGSSVGLVNVDGDNLVISYDLSADCDSDIDLDGQEQIIPLPTCSSGSCDVVGVVATGGSGFDIISNCDGELSSISCDAAGLSSGGICDPS